MWEGYETKDGEIHIIPLFDIHDHVIDNYQPCWCKPILDEDGIHVHHAADNREANKGFHTLH